MGVGSTEHFPFFGETINTGRPANLSAGLARASRCALGPTSSLFLTPFLSQSFFRGAPPYHFPPAVSFCIAVPIHVSLLPPLIYRRRCAGDRPPLDSRAPRPRMEGMLQTLARHRALCYRERRCESLASCEATGRRLGPACLPAAPWCGGELASCKPTSGGATTRWPVSCNRHGAVLQPTAGKLQPLSSSMLEPACTKALIGTGRCYIRKPAR